MSKRLKIFCTLLTTVAVLGMAAAPVLAGCSRSCEEVMPCCSVEPQEVQGCCPQEKPASDPASSSHTLCDCNHGSHGPAEVTQAITVAPTQFVATGSVYQPTAERASEGARAYFLDEQRGPPGLTIFLFDCVFLI